MRRLVWFEWKKHFISIPILLILILFTIVDLMKIKGQFEQEAVFSTNRGAGIQSDFTELYGEFRGKITSDKQKDLEQIYERIEERTGDRTASNQYDPDTITGNIYQDEMLIKKCFWQPMEYYSGYQSYIKKIVRTSLYNITFYKDIGNRYEQRKYTYIANTFYGRNIKKFVYAEMLPYYFGYNTSSFLVLLLCLYGIAGVFVMEKEAEMDTLLMTTKLGGSVIRRSKVISVILYITVVQLYFAWIDFIAFYLLYKPKDILNSPIYIVSDFANTPLNISVFHYILLTFLIRWLGVVSFGMFFLLLSNLFSHGLYPVIYGLLFILAGYMMRGEFSNSEFPVMKIINPYELITNADLFHTCHFVKICNYPVPVYVLCTAAGILWILFAVVGIRFSAGKSQYRKGRGKNAKFSV